MQEYLAANPAMAMSFIAVVFAIFAVWRASSTSHRTIALSNLPNPARSGAGTLESAATKDWFDPSKPIRLQEIRKILSLPETATGPKDFHYLDENQVKNLYPQIAQEQGETQIEESSIDSTETGFIMSIMQVIIPKYNKVNKKEKKNALQI